MFSDSQIRSVSRNIFSEEPNYQNYLLKWTNYIKGYRKRWFVIDKNNGILYYYKNEHEKGKPMGCINLLNTLITTYDQHTIILKLQGSNNVYLKTKNEKERQKWITRIEMAKSGYISKLESEDNIEKLPIKHEIHEYIESLNVEFKKLTVEYKRLYMERNLFIEFYQENVLNQLSTKDKEVRRTSDTTKTGKVVLDERQSVYLKQHVENISASFDDAFKTSKSFLNSLSNEISKWNTLFLMETKKVSTLENIIEDLDKTKNLLEKNIARKSFINANQPVSESQKAENFASDIIEKNLPHEKTDNASNFANRHSSIFSETGEYYQTNIDSDNDEFFDANTDSFSEFSTVGHLNSENNEVDDDEEFEDSIEDNSTPPFMDDSQISHKSEEEIYDPNSIKKNRRTIILSKPNKSISIWSLIKGAMGKDLSRIPIPVNFSEPISMLQRVCEQFEYAEILHKAANTDNVYEQLALLASFCVSGYAITKIRNGKPFNPLLGETYECDRMADLGWKYFSEQVSHHPPITAYYVIGKGWRWWGEFSIQSTFRYNIYVKPTGVEHVEFFNTKAHYSLKKVNTTITGLMTTITIYNYGDMYITNDENMDQCHLTFENKSILRTYKYGVSGVIYDKSKTPKWLLNGTWDKYMEGARVIKMNDGVDANKVQTDPMKSIWRVRPVPDRLKECYNFTDLTVQLNEPEVGVCPTDSRLRPDQRFMENQKFDEANNTKFLLEEKQRSVRREKERKFQESMDKNIPYQSYKPLWFDYKTIKEKSFYVYNNKYWEAKSKQDWIKCPDLYL